MKTFLVPVKFKVKTPAGRDMVETELLLFNWFTYLVYKINPFYRWYRNKKAQNDDRKYIYRNGS